MEMEVFLSIVRKKKIPKGKVRSMKVLLVDQQALWMEAIQNLLTANGFEVVGRATNYLEAFDKAKTLKPEVILMDVQIGETSGIEMTRMMRQNDPEIKIVMFTEFQDEMHLFEAIRAGAFGYLLKSMKPEKFLESLNGIALGEMPFASGMVAKVLAQFALRENERKNAAAVFQEISATLTPQQITILKLVSQGLVYKKVAQKLGLSEAAIKYHMGEVKRRLQLKNRRQAVAYVSELELGHEMKRN
ncbi:response regulator [Hydrogenispora ethanolica]|nr:response regulator transcription factor [Hydrogenispora ethanolica]